MTTSTLLARRLGLSTVSVELQTGRDGQGAPAYGAASEIEARVKEEVEVSRDQDGQEVRTDLTLWIPAGETPVPVENARVTYDGATFISVERKAVKNVRGTLVHTRVRCRREGV